MLFILFSLFFTAYGSENKKRTNGKKKQVTDHSAYLHEVSFYGKPKPRNRKKCEDDKDHESKGLTQARTVPEDKENLENGVSDEKSALGQNKLDETHSETLLEEKLQKKGFGRKFTSFFKRSKKAKNQENPEETFLLQDLKEGSPKDCRIGIQESNGFAKKSKEHEDSIDQVKEPSVPSENAFEGLENHQQLDLAKNQEQIVAEIKEDMDDEKFTATSINHREEDGEKGGSQKILIQAEKSSEKIGTENEAIYAVVHKGAQKKKDDKTKDVFVQDASNFEMFSVTLPIKKDDIRQENEQKYPSDFHDHSRFSFESQSEEVSSEDSNTVYVSEAKLIYRPFWQLDVNSGDKSLPILQKSFFRLDDGREVSLEQFKATHSTSQQVDSSSTDSNNSMAGLMKHRRSSSEMPFKPKNTLQSNTSKKEPSSEEVPNLNKIGFFNALVEANERKGKSSTGKSIFSKDKSSKRSGKKVESFFKK